MSRYPFLRNLDREAFFGFRIWEFSIQSLVRQYGIIFLWQVVIKHPVRTLKGLQRYRQEANGYLDPHPIIPVGLESVEEFKQSTHAANRLLVTAGFCQKPIRQGEDGVDCPSGRFTHDCQYLENFVFGETLPSSLHVACRSCDLRILGTKALQAKADFYIMTSAKDIAKDIFFPALEKSRFSTTIFFLCPYSSGIIALPLLICGIRALLVKYDRGPCLDFSDFIQADQGIKEAQTAVEKEGITTIVSILDEMKEKSHVKVKDGNRSFEKRGNLFVFRSTPNSSGAEVFEE